ncbi:DUF4340 domain-containing protein [Hyphomonas sp.]|uniref:DUF4340 domain-containing protein n=1 Tax=Hyphomonas sp. TaxID=87 RepID=UPI00391BBBE2
MSTLRDARRGRRVLVMAGVAGALAAMAALANMGGAAAPRSERTGKPVLPDFAAKRAEATGIRVILADESYMLVATGEGWKLGGSDGYPVRQDRLADLAEGLEGLTWDVPRTEDPAKLNAVGLGDPREGGTGALVEILGPEGEVSASIITGRKDAWIYARLPDESRAYRVKGSLPPFYAADAWLDLNFLGIHEDAISGVRLSNAAGENLYLQRTIGASDRAFRPGPPYQNYRLTSRLAVSGPALALTRFMPIGVKSAAALRTEPVARHITETHDGLEVDVRAYRERDGFFITMRAIEAGEGAQRAAAINERTKGWAFQLTQADWMDYAPPISEIVQPPG